MNLPEKITRALLELRRLFHNQTNPPPETDWVGYEGLIKYIDSNDLLSIKGDLLEIGTFLGGGAYKLSKYIEKRGTKKLYVIDIFSPNFDCTINTDGDTMKSLYQNALKKYEGKTQWEVFSNVTHDCKNIVALKEDSKTAKIPCENLCFAFVDGNHSPDYIENDFYLVWNKLSSNGVIAFHDYKFDLPQTTAKIDELIVRNSSEIKKTIFDAKRHIVYLTKGPRV